MGGIGLIAMTKSVEDVLFEMVGICESLDLSYVILGGLAVRVHGIPRPTYDVDFGLAVDDRQLSDFFEAALHAQMGKCPRNHPPLKHRPRLSLRR